MITLEEEIINVNTQILCVHYKQLGEVDCCCPESIPINSVALKGENWAAAHASGRASSGFCLSP